MDSCVYQVFPHYFDRRHTVAIDPYSTLGAAGAVFQFDHGAIHAQCGMIPATNLLGVALDVMADQRTAKAVISGVGKAAVHQLAVEEEDIPGLHEDRLHRRAW